MHNENSKAATKFPSVNRQMPTGNANLLFYVRVKVKYLQWRHSATRAF